MKKFNFSRLNYLVAFAVAVVFNILTVGCTDVYDVDSDETRSRMLLTAVKPAVPALDFYFQRTDSTAAENSFSTEWNSTETTTDTKVYGKLSVATSHQDGNAVLEAELNKVVDLSYAQKHTTYGELKSVSQLYGSTMRGTYAMRIVAQLGDQGTMCYLDAENIIEKAVVRDTMRFFPADSILFGKAQVTNLRFVEKPATRAAAEFIDKNDPRTVEVTWNVPVKRVHDKSSFTYDVKVIDNVVVYPIKKNDIVNVETDTLRVLVDPTIVNCVVRHNFTYKNGETGKSEKSATIKCSLNSKPEWSENVTNTNFSFIEAERVKYGTPYTPTDMLPGEGCSYLERVDEFTVVNGNGSELIKNPYTFKHQSVTIKDEFGVYEFGFVNPDFRQVSTMVNKVSETSTLETARLFNTIEVSYLGGRQMGEETVLLKREIDEYVISTKLDNLSAMTTVTNDSIIWSIDKLTNYSTDRQTRQSVRFGISRKLVLGAAWTSIQDNTNHQTGDYVPSLNNSYKRSATVDGVTFSYTLREKVYTSNVVLNDGKTVKNTFTATEAEDCVAQLGDDNCPFGNQAVTVKHSDNVTGGAEKDGFKVYNYTDKVSYTFGNNTKNFNLNGTIKIAEEEFSFPYGDVKLARQTTTLTEDGNDYMYVISVQFMNGVVVPGFITRGSDKVVWHLELAENVEGSNKFNSVVYTSEGWKNCTAHDVYTADYLIWYRGNTELRRVDFNKAAALNWDNGYLRDDNGKNHLTVYTNHFRLEIAKGKLYVSNKDSGTQLSFIKY